MGIYMFSTHSEAHWLEFSQISYKTNLFSCSLKSVHICPHLVNFKQLSTFNVKPTSSKSTLEASFSPEGMFVMSGKLFIFARVTFECCGGSNTESRFPQESFPCRTLIASHFS